MKLSDMNIIVLIAGKGSRTEDYSNLPKPMIEINGSPIIKRTTDSLPFFNSWKKSQIWFAVLREHVDQFGIDNWLRNLYGQDINVVIFENVTRGNLETAAIVYDQLPAEATHQPLLILDGDNEYDGSKIVNSFIEYRDIDHAIVYYFDPDGNSHWCFAMQRNNIVYDLQEKNPHAEFVGGLPMIGVFYFSKGMIFEVAATDVLEKSEKTVNEFYMSQAIKNLFGKTPVYGFKVPHVIPLGTTADLKKATRKKLIICLDLDDTINYCKKSSELYGNEKLQEGVIDTLNKWKEDGHYIVIQTARHMNTCKGNVGKVLAKQGLTTLQWLKDNKIPYDEIHFTKPHADLFIDDKALRHEIGNWTRTKELVENFIETGGKI